VDGVPAEVASDLEEADTFSGAANCLISTEIARDIEPKMKSLPNIGVVIGTKVPRALNR